MSSLFGLRQLFYLVTPADFDTRNSTLDQLEVAFSASMPFGVAAVVLEILYAISIRHRKTLYDMNDSICGGTTFLILLISRSFCHLSEYGVYTALHQRFAIISLPDNLFSWIVCAVLVDLMRYWSHRACHEVGFLWAIHKVHHSSEYLNLTSAFRGSFLQEYFSWAFYCMLAFIVPPKMMLIHLALNLIYPFWLHTQTIPKLGMIEKFLVTPSMHRVHHGRNAYCIDKNYGNLLRCWDDLFGTFAEERDDELICYGTCEPVNTFNGVFQTFNLVDVAKKMRCATNMTEKTKCLLLGPAWQPDGFQSDAKHATAIASGITGHAVKSPQAAERMSPEPRFKSPNTVPQSLYNAGQMAFVVMDLPILINMLAAESLTACSLLYTVYVLYSFSTVGYLMDSWQCYFHQECVRQVFNGALLLALWTAQAASIEGAGQFQPFGQQLSLLLFILERSRHYAASNSTVKHFVEQRLNSLIVFSDNARKQE